MKQYWQKQQTEKQIKQPRRLWILDWTQTILKMFKDTEDKLQNICSKHKLKVKKQIWKITKWNAQKLKNTKAVTETNKSTRKFKGDKTTEKRINKLGGQKNYTEYIMERQNYGWLLAYV